MDHLPTPPPRGPEEKSRHDRDFSTGSAGSPNDDNDYKEDSSCLSYVYSENDTDDDDDNSVDEYEDSTFVIPVPKDDETTAATAPLPKRRRDSIPSSSLLLLSSTSSRRLTAVPDGGHCFWTIHEARRCMEDAVEETANLLCVPHEAATVLLRAHKWDAERLVEEYFGRSDAGRRELLVECGVLKRCGAGTLLAKKDNIMNSATIGGSCNTLTAARKEPTGSCLICLDDDLAANDLYSMACGHEFCRSCWQGYLVEAVASQGPRCVYTQCPHQNCKEVVTELEVCELTVPEDHVIAKFVKHQFRSYVQTNRIMRWCPGPSCDMVAVGSSSAGLVGEGQCPSCKTMLCLKCGEMRHTPATCDRMALWREKNKDADGSNTASWILTKAKKCPKCNTPIEKNGGCSRMFCTHCRNEFCWLCMQDWKVHGYDRACNKFELDQASKTTDAENDCAKRDFEHYLHCFERFGIHSQAEDFARGELDTIIKTKDEREASDFSFDWNALQDALSQVAECRRVLKYTYVVAYYLGHGPVQQFELFQDHQASLERFTERLSEITEKECQLIDRTELVNLTRVVGRYAERVMDCEKD